MSPTRASAARPAPSPQDPARAWVLRALLPAALLAAGACRAPGKDPAAPTEGEQGNRGDTLWIAPPSDFYPRYIASPRRAQSAIVIMGVPDSEIDLAGSGRWGIRLGGQLGLVRVHPEGDPTRGFQIDFEAGFSGQFDRTQSLDNIGWDGLYGMQLAYKPRSDLGFHFGTLHDSAHVGDEHAERTGRQRIGYTREEFVLGASWWPDGRWRLYTEAGLGYRQKSFQDPWRIEAGAEYLGARTFWDERLRWYAAGDLDWFEERDWSPAVTAQLGFLLPTGRGNSRHRFAIEAFHGRSWLGEFSFDDETYLALGWFYDI